ncbi:redoxin domain-containing protein [Chitinophaga lutea]
MKKSSFLPALLLLPAFAGAQTKFTVNGKVGQYNAPVTAFIRYIADGKPKVDSAVLNNGAFTFTGTTDEPSKAMMSLRHPNASRAVSGRENLAIYLESGVITVTSPDSIRTATVKGGVANKDARDLAAAQKSVQDEYNALMTEYMSKSPDEQKDTTFIADISERFKKNAEARKANNKKFLETHKSSIVALDVLKEYLGSTPEYAEGKAAFDKLDKSVRESKSGVKYGERLEKVKAVAIGNAAPAFSQNDTEGKPVSLASFRGKYVLIDFWASWCGPCRAENPHVVEAFNQYKDKNFTVLGVSLDRPDAKDKWIKAIADDKLAWTQVSDLNFWQNEVAQLYAVNSIPQNFLVDPKGIIVAKNLRGDKLKEKLAELLK